MNQNIMTPQNIHELRDIVAWAKAEKEPLAIKGQGTKDGLGPSVHAAYELSTRALSGIDLYEPDELVMSAGAGTLLSDVEEQLASRQQCLAFEPADYGLILNGRAKEQTIGGVFACNISGPRRFHAGAARDHLLGLQVVTGLGQIIKTGGRVVKNVTGYDLCKLMAGSFGTLAVMSHLTFKVVPKPETEGTLVLTGATMEALLSSLRKASGSPFEISGAAFVPHNTAKALTGSSEDTAFIRIEGEHASLRERLDGLLVFSGHQGKHRVAEHEESSCIWQSIKNVSPLQHKEGTLWRVSIPPSATFSFCRHFQGPWLADWVGGLVWCRTDGEKPVLEESGHALLMGSAGDREQSVFEPLDAPLMALHKRVKESFDAEHILNPGRLYQGV